MEIFNGILGITHAELTDGIMTEGNIKILRHRGRINQIRRGCLDTPALFEVESFPPRFKAEIKRRYPNPQAQAEAMSFVDTVTIDMAAASYYESVRIDGPRGLSYEKMSLYTNSASILNACRAKLAAAADEQRKVGRSHRVKLSDFWAAMAKHLPRVAEIYPHVLPENPRVLQRKFNEYFRGGEPHYEALISGKFCNKNAASVATEEQIAFLTKFIGYHTNLDCVEVADYFNTVAEGKGWKKISRQTVWKWAQTYGWAVNAGRHGAKAYLGKLGMQVKRAAPTAPLQFWSLDGWVVELYYKKRTEGKRGGTTSYCNRMVVVVVLDPYNKYPVGYATGYKESTGLIKEALRDAVNHTSELFGQRYRPVQIQSDNYQIKALLPVYGAIADHVTPAHVGNAQAKPIEPYFKRLNHRYAKKCSGNWSGYGITSRKESQPNMEWLNAHKGQIPDEQGVRRQIDWIIESERTLKREAYMAGFAKTPTERLLRMPQDTYLLTFGEETGFKNALEGSGLNVRILGERRTYDSFDLDFRKHAHLRWNVKYDPDDLGHVLAVSDEGDLRFMLEEKYVQPMALSDRRPGDAAQLERVERFNENLKRAVVNFDTRATETVRQSLLRHPDLANPYATSLITDSRGQNKDRRSQYRLEYTDAAEEASYEETNGVDGTVSTRDLY